MIMDIRKILDSPFLYDVYHDIIGHEKKTFAKEYLKDIKGKRILDIGCGTAQIVSRLAGFETYLGIDMSRRYIEYAKKKYATLPNVEFRCMNLNDLTGDQTQRFDIVIMMGIMMNLDDNEINARTYFIAFGVKHIAGHIVTDVVLQYGIHSNLVNTS